MSYWEFFWSIKEPISIIFLEKCLTENGGLFNVEAMSIKGTVVILVNCSWGEVIT